MLSEKKIKTASIKVKASSIKNLHEQNDEICLNHKVEGPENDI